METVSTRIPTPDRRIRGGAKLTEALRALARPDLGERGCGRPVTDHRSTWVRVITSASQEYYVKTYDYPTTADQWRGALRNTGPWNRSRAAREFDAMAWMRLHAVPSATPVGVLEARRFGFLRRAILLTEGFVGASVASLLPELASTDREALGTAIGALVGRLHALGFRDRNLDTRNLLATRNGNGPWCVVKIDSPRFVLRRPGAADDALAAADWARLLPQLEPFGIAAVARRAAT